MLTILHILTVSRLRNDNLTLRLEINYKVRNVTTEINLTTRIQMQIQASVTLSRQFLVLTPNTVFHRNPSLTCTCILFLLQHVNM